MILNKFKLYILLLIPLLLSHTVYAVQIDTPELKFKSTEVFVSFSFRFEEKEKEILRKGGEKEVIFYIDLFRYWEVFPDEFITGLKIIRHVYSDPMKKEFIATSFDGNILLQKRFKSFETMLKWAFNFKDIKVADLKPLPEAVYFVKITAEAKAKGIPSIISELFFFLPSREFKIERKTFYFRWRKGKIEVIK